VPERTRSRSRGTSTVIFSGGGTGGHLYPALALAEALAGRRPDVEPWFVGAERGIEARVLPARGVSHLLLPVEGFRRSGGMRGMWANVGVLVALARSLALLAGQMRERRPALVVVTGGYAGGAAGILAILMRIPLALQEQNSVPGLTIRLLALGAREVHLAFPEARGRLPRAARKRARVTGNPVRPPEAVDRPAAEAGFGLAVGGPVVLVVGGSQGSKALNEAVIELVEAAVEGGLPGGARLLWATGPTHLEPTRAALEARCGGGIPPWVAAVGYIETMPRALALAEVAVSRAGAMGTSEFLAWGIPAILVPLPTAAADHQTRNARALEEAGAAVALPETELSGARLLRELSALLGDPARLAAMAGAARARGRPGAAVEIAASLEAHLPPPGAT
jgi:UDP-N-acetylglucosamine--N-acetylmuramyl-(pentapeptide) pyrophosphoryl-undecaprenol N-acetylglucosamine transferase